MNGEAVTNLKELERQKREQEKLERKQKRLEERIARKEMKKKQREEEKLAEKEERLAEKEKKKQQRLEERFAKKEQKKKEDEIKFGLVKLPTKDSWPKEEGSTLFLDGNNMLYVLSAVRAAVLKRHVAKAEKMIELIAREFTQKAKLDKCVLIFDDTRTKIVEDRFEVCSARPSFATSDDALVHWCQNREPALYVTSDRELIQRLTDAKGKVCKPKEWFIYAAKIIEGDDSKVESLDEWALQFFARHNIEC